MALLVAALIATLFSISEQHRKVEPDNVLDGSRGALDAPLTKASVGQADGYVFSQAIGHGRKPSRTRRLTQFAPGPRPAPDHAPRDLAKAHMSETHEGAPEGVTEDTAAADLAATETEATATAEDGDTGDDAAAETEAGAEGEQPKRKQTVQERINEKTRLQREAERERDYWREQALRTQKPEPRQEPKAEAEDAEPDPSDYEHGELDARFIREHATYHARKTFREEQARTEAERTRSQQLSAFEAAADAEAQKRPDYYDVVGRDFGRAAAVCTPVMSDALVASPDGPTLAYHLAKNPAEARRIAALAPLAQALELGKLSAKLASPPAPTAKTATDAPAPTPQVRGAGGRFNVAADTDDFAAFEKQYGV